MKKGLVLNTIIVGVIVLVVVVVSIMILSKSTTKSIKPLSEIASDYLLSKQDKTIINSYALAVNKFLEVPKASVFVSKKKYVLNSEESVRQASAALLTKIRDAQNSFVGSVNEEQLTKAFNSLAYELTEINTPYAKAEIAFTRKDYDKAKEGFKKISILNKKFLGVEKASKRLKLLNCDFGDDVNACLTIGKEFCYFESGILGDSVGDSCKPCSQIKSCSDMTFQSCKEQACNKKIKCKYVQHEELRKYVVTRESCEPTK